MAEKVSPEEVAQLLKEPSTDDGGGLPPEKGLEILGTDPETLHTSAGDIHIAPMTMGQIRKFMVHAEKFLPELASQQKANNFNLSSLMTLGGPDFWRAMAVAAKTSPEKLDSLLPNEFITVATKILLVNMDFFVRILPTALGRAELSLLHAIVNYTKTLGSHTESSSSSPTDTASETSKATPSDSSDSF